MALKDEISLPRESERDFTVAQHKIVYGIGALIIGAGMLFLVLEILYHLSVIPLWIYGMIAAVFLLGILVCLEVKNRQLAVCGNQWYYRNIFGKVKSYTLEDIGSAKIVCNASGGKDDLRIYNKEGKMLCRLEWSMQNMDIAILWLRDNGIAVHMERNRKQALPDIHQPLEIEEKELRMFSKEVYGQAKKMAETWMEKNRKLGADLVYGFAEYHGSKVDGEAEIQARESRIEKGGAKPEDYICVLEIYVKKDGFFVRDKKKRLLAMAFPVFYKRKDKTVKGEIRLYYEEEWKTDLEDSLQLLLKYLPGHKFFLEQMEIEYELQKEV